QEFASKLRSDSRFQSIDLSPLFDATVSSNEDNLNKAEARIREAIVLARFPVTATAAKPYKQNTPSKTLVVDRPNLQVRFGDKILRVATGAEFKVFAKLYEERG